MGRSSIFRRKTMEFLWTDFLNSMWHDWRGSGESEDRLKNPEWLHSFVNKWNFAPPFPIDEKELEELVALRELMEHIALSVSSNNAINEEELETFNTYLEKSTLKPQLVNQKENFDILMGSLKTDTWQKVMSEITYSFAKIISDGETERIRRCSNPDCKWFYYDNTRNKSKIYCTNNLCGNLMKVRRFREKNKKNK